MSNFIPPNTITADGSYEINTRFSRKHLLTLKDDFGGGTVTMTAYNDASGDYEAVDGGSWTAAAEITFDAPSDTIRLTLAGATDPNILVTLTPLNASRSC
jgi:hypothetical protein